MTSRIPTDMVADRTSKAKLSDTLGSIQTSINTNTSSLASIVTQTASSPPITGTWKLADKVWNTNPVSGGIMGWVCVQAGTFGSGNSPVFKEFGIIST